MEVVVVNFMIVDNVVVNKIWKYHLQIWLNPYNIKNS